MSTPCSKTSIGNSPSPPRKRKKMIITLKDKMKIINEMEKGKRRVDIARDFGISASSAAYIYLRKDSIIEQYERKFGVDEDERSVPLAQALLGWFERQIDANIPISDPDMRHRAEELAAELGVENFECTDRWLADFNATYNIVRDTRYPNPATSSNKQDWFHLHEGYEEREVYAAGGTALLYDANLTTYRTTDKHNNISILLATNVTGTHKYRPTIVGIDKTPPAFVGITSLPVDYARERGGLISHSIITCFLVEWDAELSKHNKRILLLLDDKPEFKGLPLLSNIKCLQANISSMFQEVTSCFKYHYRRLQITQSVGNEGKVHTGLLEASRLICLAWNCVTPQIIYDTFHPPVYGCLYFDTRSEERALNEENDECSLIKWAQTHEVTISPECFENLDDFLVCDAGLPYLSSESKSPPTQPPPIYQTDVETTQKPPALEAFDAMKRLVRYLQSTGAPTSTLDAASSIENHIEYGVLIEIYNNYRDNTDADV